LEPQATENNQEQFKEEYEEYQEQEQQNQFKWHRRLLFALGKTFKYTCWAGFVFYCYHLHLVFNKDKPENAFAANQKMLDYAHMSRNAYTEVKELMTLPPSRALIGERPNIPGLQFPKTLVLNVNGTLVHSEYKFGVGFEILKRPGLSVFMNRLQ